MRFNRCEQLLGKESLEKLNRLSVAVFGIGGVGGYVVETLVRSGVGKVALIDKDVVDETNINRQIIALTSTIGKSKVEVMKERVLDINPNVVVEAYEQFYLPENACFIDVEQYDYVVDAMDNVTAKTELIKRCAASGVSVISAMGAGNKTDVTALRIDDVNKTSVCPLAKIMRRKLSENGIKGVKAAYSVEQPKKTPGVRTPASMMAVPASMGILIASEVIKDAISR